jgi:hypothetical protein
LAAARYQKAFAKKDEKRYADYLELLKNPLQNPGVKINAQAVYPYDVIKSLQKGIAEVANEQWKALPNYMEGAKDMILPVVDVSGSMSTPASGSSVSCLDVSVSLSLYISERNEGPFKDYFITFSESPELQKLKGNLIERYNQISNSEWGMSTNLESVFDLILNQAIKHDVPENEMPGKILILSDMEFNSAIDSSSRDLSAIELIRIKYEEAGYKTPNIIFWNLQSRGKNLPVRFDENGTALISGFSPSILKSILACKDINPISIMRETIDSERYQKISI